MAIGATTDRDGGMCARTAVRCLTAAPCHLTPDRPMPPAIALQTGDPPARTRAARIGERVARGAHNIPALGSLFNRYPRAASENRTRRRDTHSRAAETPHSRLSPPAPRRTDAASGPAPERRPASAHPAARIGERVPRGAHIIRALGSLFNRYPRAASENRTRRRDRAPERPQRPTAACRRSLPPYRCRERSRP